MVSGITLAPPSGTDVKLPCRAQDISSSAAAPKIALHVIRPIP